MSPRNGNITGSTSEGGARGGDTRSAQQRVRRNTVNPASSTPPLAQPPWNQTHQYHHPTPQQAFPAAVSHIAPQNRQPLQQSFRQQPLHSQLQLPISERSLAIDGFYACCFQEINRFAYGRTLSQESRRRLNLLTEAVSTQDGTYLALHNFYCLSRVDINSIPLDLRTQEFFQTAISLLDKVLSSNNHLSNEVLHFFANFPMRINTIMEKWPPGFTLERTPLITFITKSAGFGCFQGECHRRRFPPVMRELFDDLGIHSWTLQRVVFDHIAGHLLGILPSPQYRQTLFNYRSQAIQEFIASQHAFYERIKTRPDDDDGSDRAIEKDYWSRLWAHFGEEMKQHRLTPDSLPRPSGQSINTQSDLGVIRQPQEHDTPLTRHGQAPYNPRRLLPPPGWQLPPMHKPMPWCSALHQAGLRSPDLRANKNVKLGGYPLYQYVSGFARAPARLADTVGGVEKWTFTVTPSQWQSLPKDVPGLAGAPATRFLDDTNQALRLRCIKWAEDELPNDHEWAVADTLWIPYSYFTLNGTSLEQRKKIHYGRDLPIDLTSLLKKGDNRLDIAVMRTSDDESYLDYLVAIEIVATTTHAAIRESCLSRNYISYSRRIEEIKQQLSASSGDDDDDIVVLESGCPIDLIDPLSMFKVCDIPVRGTACTHYECFDLETFLKTRKRKRDGDATKPDRWQCPVCKQDARPQHLMVDGFLDAVRDELARNGLLDNTKSITVASDGTWEPKVEDNGITDRSDVDIEVIDLSD